MTRTKLNWGEKEDKIITQILWTRKKVDLEELSAKLGFSKSMVRKYISIKAKEHAYKVDGLWMKDIVPIRKMTFDEEAKSKHKADKSLSKQGSDYYAAKKPKGTYKHICKGTINGDTIRLVVKAKNKTLAKNMARADYNMKVIEVYTVEEYAKVKPKTYYPSRQPLI